MAAVAVAAAAHPASLKYVSLVVLCLQNSLLAILMRLSRVGDHPKFNTSTAVFVGEVFKLVTCSAIIFLVRLPHCATYALHDE